MSDLSAYVLVDLVTNKRWRLPAATVVTLGSAAQVLVPGLTPQHLRVELNAGALTVTVLAPTRISGKAYEPGATLSSRSALTFVVSNQRFSLELSAESKPDAPLKTQEFDVDGLLPAGDAHSALESLLYQAQVSLHPLQALEQLYDAICELALQTTIATRAVVLMADGNGELSPKSVRSVSGVTGSDNFVASRSVLNKLMIERKTVLIADVSRSAEFSAQASLVSAQVRSALAAPIFDGNAVLGVLYVDSSGDEAQASEPLQQVDASLLTVLSALSGAAIVAARAVERVLTSEQKLRHEVARLERLLAARG